MRYRKDGKLKGRIFTKFFILEYNFWNKSCHIYLNDIYRLNIRRRSEETF